MNKLLTRLALIYCCLGLSIQTQAQNFNSQAPNATQQQAAFTGQTRAPLLSEQYELHVEVITTGLEHPWGMAQLPNGSWLVTERPGRMRLVKADGELSEPITGLPAVDTQGQGGLLDVIIHDDFDNTHRVWWSYAEPRGASSNATAVATGILSKDYQHFTEVNVIFQQEPAWQSAAHFGSRLVFDNDGMLFITTGDRYQASLLAQDINNHIGKILRINPQGGAAPDNPNMDGGQAELWSYGHRNIQAAALANDGNLWTVEHGARGGDELNQPQAGLNYGWPIITYGVEYSGRTIGDGLTTHESMEQPVYYWDPVIAPSGMAFYQGQLFADWQDNILIGGLASQSLIRLKLEDGQVVGEARYLQREQGRIRDVAVAQDGAIMLLTDAPNGKLLRVIPRK